MNTLFERIAVTEIFTNKELLKLLKIDNLTMDKLFKFNYQKTKMVIESDRFKNYNSRKIKSINFLDKKYPDKLREIYNPPAILFYEGNIDLLNEEIIAIVGARKGTIYSEKIIDKICSRIKNKNVIVSGMATGVDTMAHFAAIKYNLPTIAVMGTGITEIYPKENRKLKNIISNQGLVLSEYPPMHQTKPYNFVNRNRIIAGLCNTLIVTEAKKKSGSLITANLALENNRNVFAVPGSMGSELSTGTNQLIQDGANVLLL